MTESNTDFHILSLSGGGIRGLYTATVLAELEAHLGVPIAKKFNLITGTSIGGILALGLAMEIPAAKLKSLFLDKGTVIFPRGNGCCWPGFRHLSRLYNEIRSVTHARQPNTGLRNVLEDESVYGERLLGEALHNVIIPTVNASTGAPQMFKTPHHQNFKSDHRMKLVDIALATSAAPTYLPIAEVSSTGDDSNKSLYVDGGLFANAPGYLALHEARHFFGIEQKQIRLLSIGTGSMNRSVSSKSSKNLGWARWRSKPFDLMISAQESVTHYMLQHDLGDRYLQIDASPNKDSSGDIASLDDACPYALRTLQSLGQQSAKATLGNAFEPFSSHTPRPIQFYYGPNSSQGDAS